MSAAMSAMAEPQQSLRRRTFRKATEEQDPKS